MLHISYSFSQPSLGELKINHMLNLFLNCPIFSVVWSKILKWLGMSAALHFWGSKHLVHFINLSPVGLFIQLANGLWILWFV